MKKDNNTANLIFGIRPVQEAIREGKAFDKVFIQNNFRGPHSTELLEEMKANEIPFIKVPSQKLDRLTRKNHQGIVAMMSPIEFQPLDETIQRVFEKGEIPNILFLDRVTDVRNFGAIVRTAECMGVQAVVVPEKGAARIGPDAIKTSAGALLRVPICRVQYPIEEIAELKNAGLRVIGVSEKGEQTLEELDLTEPQVLIMGSEDDGISPNLLKVCDFFVKIPMVGQISSLNVGVSAAIALYESLRQRSKL